MFLNKTRYKYDFGFEYNKQRYLVEFDGDQHYRDPIVIKRDVTKSLLAYEEGYILIRIPYWVQLTTETLLYYFNINDIVYQKYSHGFIDKKVMLPASFCELGD